MVKFGNSRRRIDVNLPEVVARKRTKVEKNKDLPSKSPLMWGLAKYLPGRQSSEDDQSIAMHLEWLKNESKKVSYNADAIKARMDITFGDRRELIVTQGAPIKQIIETYPALTLHNQVMKNIRYIINLCKKANLYL